MSSSQNSKQQMCFRWHISRIVGSVTSEQREIHVAITSETAKFRKLLSKHGPRGIVDEKQDRLEWWHGDRYEFEGYTTEHILLNAYIKKNVVRDLKPRVYPLSERALEEDMVLLQFVPGSSKALFHKCYTPLKTRWKKNEFPDVTSLVQIKQARWLDFTLAARRMAKMQYQKVSGTWDEKSEEENA